MEHLSKGLETIKAYPDDHHVYSNDPTKLVQLINKFVRVNMKGSTSVEGTVYAIDPVSETIALLTEKKNTIDLDLLIGTHISTVEVLHESSLSLSEDLFKSSEEKPLTVEETSRQRKKLMSWLQANMLPVIEEGDVIRVGNILSIHPPYRFNNCISESEVILERIEKLLLTMPQDM